MKFELLLRKCELLDGIIEKYTTSCCNERNCRHRLKNIVTYEGTFYVNTSEQTWNFEWVNDVFGDDMCMACLDSLAETAHISFFHPKQWMLTILISYSESTHSILDLVFYLFNFQSWFEYVTSLFISPLLYHCCRVHSQYIYVRSDVHLLSVSRSL